MIRCSPLLPTSAGLTPFLLYRGCLMRRCWTCWENTAALEPDLDAGVGLLHTKTSGRNIDQSATSQRLTLFTLGRPRWLLRIH
jgi:hypothetical protein